MPMYLRRALPIGTISGHAQPTLTGDGLSLRPWSMDDVRIIEAAYADPGIARRHAPVLAEGWLRLRTPGGSSRPARTGPSSSEERSSDASASTISTSSTPWARWASGCFPSTAVDAWPPARSVCSWAGPPNWASTGSN